MNSNVRCSIIIPTHNCIGYLRYALMSVRMQNLAGVETLVVDDGSTDGTAEWLQANTDIVPDLRILTRGGVGPSKARNEAISIAEGRFIAFLDADDVWWPEKLEKQLVYHEQNPETAFTFSDYLHFDPAGITHGTCFDYWKPTYMDRMNGEYRVVENAELNLLAANVVGTSTVVCSAAVLQNANGFATHSRSAEDWDLWLRMSRMAPVACSSAVTTNYLMRPTSVTGNKKARIASMRKTVEPYAARRDKPTRKAVRRAIARIDIAEAENHRHLGDHWRAALAHARAFAKWPHLRAARAAVSDVAAALPVGRRV